MEALQTATLNPARFLGKENDMGTVAKGKIADLVLLDANPLNDIRNTTDKLCRRQWSIVGPNRFRSTSDPSSSQSTEIAGVVKPQKAQDD